MKKGLLRLPVASLILLLTGCAFQSEPGRIVNKKESQPLKGVQEFSVRLDYGAGKLEIGPSKDPAFLYQYDLDYDEKYFTPRIDYDLFGSRWARLRFSLEGRGSVPTLKGNRLWLQLAPTLPLDLELNIGVAESRIDLSGTKLRHLEIKTGVSETFLTLETPNSIRCERLRVQAGVAEFKAVGLGNANFAVLEFNGGVGESTLDLTGEWRENAEVEINVGVGSITLVLPLQIGAESETTKKFLTKLELESFRQEGDHYLSHNFEEAAHRVHIRLKAGIGEIKVRWA
ncbi:MAG: hypothetical protein HY652_09395 [Acidobacteria bacterium]|nr:hypothetical protein [Acidobacteriota bacterium]